MTQIRRAFITGVGGFIGLRIAERLMERGFEVAGIDLDPSAAERAAGRGVRASVGDVTDGESLRQRMAGSELVIHTAAIVREYGALEVFRRVNVGGSRNVAEAAREVGAQTFVQLSSVLVYGFTYPDQVTEDGPLRGERNPYCQTKIESEQAVLALNDPPKFGVIVIRPGDVYGPGSMPWIARPLQMLRKGRLLLPAGGLGRMNYVYIDNLVDGILLAVDKRAYGEAFNIADGVSATYLEFFQRLADMAALKGPVVVPTAILQVVAWTASRFRDLGLTKDEVSLDTLKTLSRPHTYSIDKARTILGYVPRVSLEDGLALSRQFIDQELALH